MTNNATDLITIEAEDLDFDNDFIVSQIDASASGGKILRVRSDRRDAKATTTFNGPDGVYDFTLHAYDENDGQGQLKIWINGELANRTILSQNLGSNLANGQTKVQILLEKLTLRRGDKIAIEAVRSYSEYTSLDKLVFAPVIPVLPPVEIISNGGNNSAIINVDENTTAITDFNVNIGDENVEYQINAGADKDLFNIDPLTGVLSFRNAPDWEAPADADGNNVYEVNVVAAGAKSGDSQFLSVVVKDVEDTTPPPGSDNTITVEAEDLNFDRDFVVSTADASASGGKILRVRSSRRDANATTTFNGADGVYDLTLYAYDENDGKGQIKVWINGAIANKTVLDKNLGSALPNGQTKVQILLEKLNLRQGDKIEIEATRSYSEYTSLDKLVFTPVSPTLPPVEITSNGGSNSAVVNVNENTTAVTDFEVNIGDENVEYQINAGADKDLFNIDPFTGVLSFKDAPDWEAPADADGNNVYEVNVVAAGAKSGDSQFLSVVVKDVDDAPSNDSVAITSNGGGSSAAISINEGTTAVTDFDVNIGDENVSYLINDGADRDLFNIDSQTGLLSFKTAPNFQAPADADGNNVYEVNVVAAGATSGDSQFVTVKVNDVVTGGPITSFTVLEGIRAAADIDISGSQNGASFRINAGADRDLFLINPQTGVLSFKQSPDFENPQDRAGGRAIAGDNIYEVYVIAERGSVTESKFITIAVQDTDESALPAPIPVYLMAGQSNLDGEALVSNLSDSSYTGPFASAQIWSRPQADFVDLAPGFDGQTTFMGPELSFGRQIVANIDQPVYLVKYGRGSTTLAEDWHPDGSGVQFNQFKDIVDRALDSLTNQGITYDIQGLVWMQGESDTYNDAFAAAYQDNLTSFVKGSRDIYGEDLDIAVGLIRSDLPTSARNRNLVRDAQRAVSAGDSGVFLVDTDALGGSEILKAGDPTHYNANGQVLLGNAFADAFV